MAPTNSVSLPQPVRWTRRSTSTSDAVLGRTTSNYSRPRPPHLRRLQTQVINAVYTVAAPGAPVPPPPISACLTYIFTHSDHILPLRCYDFFSSTSKMSFHCLAECTACYFLRFVFVKPCSLSALQSFLSLTPSKPPAPHLPRPRCRAAHPWRACSA